jgi:hypothetical protein
MTLSDERLRELAEFLRTPGSSASWGPKPYDECADAIDELISRRASPHGEAGVTEEMVEAASQAYYLQDRIGFVCPPWDGLDHEVRHFIRAKVRAALTAALSLQPEPVAGEPLVTPLSASPGSSAGADRP